MFWFSAGLLCNHTLMWWKWDRAGKKKVSGDTAVLRFSGIMRMWNYGENCCSSVAAWFTWACHEHKGNLTQSPSTWKKIRDEEVTGRNALFFEITLKTEYWVYMHENNYKLYISIKDN